MYVFFDCLSHQVIEKQFWLKEGGYTIIDCYPVACNQDPGYFVVFKCVKKEIL